MSEPADQVMGRRPGDRPAASIGSREMIAAVIFLCSAIVFFFFVYLYARRYLRRPDAALRGRSRARFIFVAADLSLGPDTGGGLDFAALRSLPVTVYRAADFEEGLECAVCLSELADGEEARMLPSCSHGFHLECIDMWLLSHSTCPLCRTPVGVEPSMNPDSGAESTQAPPPDTSPVLPANVLIWGSQNQVNAGNSCTPEGPSSSSGALAIEIPSRFAVEVTKSPVSTRLNSLRTLWSQGKSTAGSSCSPIGGDIEQGSESFTEGIVHPPKSPANS
ncbi:hypothetical protein B296_00044596 [Ensete ventricosum]|uniref:RING-type E3 ubiquitin transferase n=1 Tax=Ensete ventricosum TaxID=4639 RepID=A0A426YJK9_ENSVE|nr:hypothetical protein B296_00044596 [Ensete ventricosum]